MSLTYFRKLKIELFISIFSKIKIELKYVDIGSQTMDYIGSQTMDYTCSLCILATLGVAGFFKFACHGYRVRSTECNGSCQGFDLQTAAYVCALQKIYTTNREAFS